MRILITGATGFIGRHLVDRLAPDHAIYALVRKVPTVPRAGVRYIEQDLADPLQYDALPRHVDAIIHQAAIIDTAAVADTIPFLVNVVATWRLLHYAEIVNVRTFLYASTGGIYGCSQQPFDERDPVNPMDLYSLTKAQAELAVQSAPGNFQRIILRYFFPYGVGTPNPIPGYVQRAVAGEPIQVPESGGPRFNPLHIADAVEATVRSLDLAGNHTVNIAGAEVTTFAAIARLAAGMVGREPLLHLLPAEATIPYYRADLVASIERMEQLLGYRPRILLAAGIRELVGKNAV